MKNKISVYQEHGNALCIKDGAFTITFFPEQVSFIEREDRFTIKIRPSVVEANLDKDEYLSLKKYSAEPSNNWLYGRAERALSDFINSGDEHREKETQWKALKKEIDLQFKNKNIKTK